MAKVQNRIETMLKSKRSCSLLLARELNRSAKTGGGAVGFGGWARPPLATALFIH